MTTLLAACHTPSLEAATTRGPSIEVRAVPHDSICVTKGKIADLEVRAPTVRAFARASTGDAASLRFTFQGASPAARALASGELRRQLGLKLRAQDSCNVVYVMWRLDPRPELEVQVKSNPGLRTHKDCGADGYTKVRPAHAAHVPELAPGSTHTLRAEILGDALTAWIDGRAVWHGELPASARALHGPAGLRSDNVSFDIAELAAPPAERAGPACKHPDE